MLAVLSPLWSYSNVNMHLHEDYLTNDATCTAQLPSAWNCCSDWRSLSCAFRQLGIQFEYQLVHYRLLVLVQEDASYDKFSRVWIDLCGVVWSHDIMWHVQIHVYHASLDVCTSKCTLTCTEVDIRFTLWNCFMHRSVGLMGGYVHQYTDVSCALARDDITSSALHLTNATHLCTKQISVSLCFAATWAV